VRGESPQTLAGQLVAIAFFTVQWCAEVGKLSVLFSFPTSAWPLDRENAGLSRSRLRQGGDFLKKWFSFLENTTRFLTELQAMRAFLPTR